MQKNSNIIEITSLTKVQCQSCSSEMVSIFHELRSVPTNSCILLSSKKEAIGYPKGDISLGFCQECGFISNVAYDPKLTEYSGRYEETQGFSDTFNAFHRDLANRLIDRYNLHGKDIIEIGCGKGEFLTMLCELGGNRGVGFDPAYVSARNQSRVKDQITFINDFYSEKYSNYRGNFIVCKMTLEHIQSPFDFVTSLRRTIGERLSTIIFIQVPDVTRILRDCAFEDIYYEHCSYFSPGSLAHLFRKCGFDVIDLWNGYDEQYIMMVAKPAIGRTDSQLAQENYLETQKQDVMNYTKKYQHKLDTWQVKLEEIRANKQRVVLWGSGSKAVAFLTSLNIIDEIAYVVDVNPYRQGFYMAGTGQKIVAPDFLKKYKPDIVIVMNPIYLDEIQEDLKKIGLFPEIIKV